MFLKKIWSLMLFPFGGLATKNILKTSLLALWYVFACAEKDNNPVMPDNENWQYPLKKGAQWKYVREISYDNIQPQSLKVPFLLDSTITSQVEIVVSSKVIINDTVEAYLLIETMVSAGTIPMVDQTFYNNLENGLYFYGYKGAGFVIPKAAGNNKILFKGKYYYHINQLIALLEKAMPSNTVASDTIIYERPPLLALNYPLMIGKQWTYRQAYQSWRIDKKVIAKETITVPAGSFVCLKIQWLHDMDNNGSWDEEVEFYDFISAKGLICRSIKLKNIVITDEANPEGIGRYDYAEESVLAKVNF